MAFANVLRRRSYSAPPCAFGGPSESEQTTGHTITFTETYEESTGEIARVWHIKRHEDHSLLRVDTPTATAGDVVKASSTDVLKVFMYVDALSLHPPGTDMNFFQPNVDSSEPVEDAMDALTRDYPHLVQYVACLQHLRRGCKHVGVCEYYHATEEEIGNDNSECTEFKLSGFCRFRCPQVGRKACRKAHREDVQPVCLPPITHKAMSQEMFTEVMKLVERFAQRMNVGEETL